MSISMRGTQFVFPTATDEFEPVGAVARIELSRQVHESAWRYLQYVVREFFRHAAWDYVFCRVWEDGIDFQCNLSCRRVTLALRSGCIRKNIAGCVESIRSIQNPGGKFCYELRGRLYKAAPLVVEMMGEAAMVEPSDSRVPLNRNPTIERYWKAAISAHGSHASPVNDRPAQSTALHYRS